MRVKLMFFRLILNTALLVAGAFVVLNGCIQEEDTKVIIGMLMILMSGR